MNLFDKAIKDGHLELSGSGSRERIKYKATGFSDRFDDPEELVRAEFYAELIYSYEYSPERIGVEVAVPDRVPSDRADLVVFRDDKRTKPFAVVECKARDVSDADFVQSIEQACGNGTWARFRADFVGVVAGLTRRFLDFTPNYGISEREANIIADLPRSYGKPGEFRFHKGSASHDIRRVDKGDMLVAFRKCHQTLWGAGNSPRPQPSANCARSCSSRLPTS